MARSTKLTFLTLLILGGGFYFFLSPSPPPFFSPEMISSSLKPRPQWAIAPLASDEAERVRSILSQKFTFLGEGAQAIAFQSEDGKYVLKFFKMRRFTPSWSDELCPHVVRRRFRNLHWVFNGYKNAYQDLRKETGLIWIHLNKTDNLHQTIQVHDREGLCYHLDADSTEFVIQEKAELIFRYLNRLRKEGKMGEVEKAIASIRSLIQHRINQGYADRDTGVKNNYGFVGDRPIHLDIGRLYKGQKDNQLERMEKALEEWRSKIDMP